MKQIILNITVDENGLPTTILNYTKSNDEKIVKVIQASSMTENDKKFIENIEQLILNNYGNL